MSIKKEGFFTPLDQALLVIIAILIIAKLVTAFDSKYNDKTATVTRRTEEFKQAENNSEDELVLLKQAVIPDEVWEKIFIQDKTSVDYQSNINTQGNKEDIATIAQDVASIQNRMTNWLARPSQVTQSSQDKRIGVLNDAIETLGIKAIILDSFNPDNISDPRAYVALTLPQKKRIIAVALTLQDNSNYTIRSIRGYTDNRPLVSPQAIKLYSDNNGLAKKRAEEVAKYLIASQQVMRRHSVIQGYTQETAQDIENIIKNDTDAINNKIEAIEVCAGLEGDRFGSEDAPNSCAVIVLQKQ